MLKIFYLRISDFDKFADAYFFSGVSEETSEAVVQYRSAKVRRTKLLGEVMVGELLRMVFGLEKGTYRLVKGEHGKPYVAGSAVPVFFNLSHSGDYIVCALSEQEVGVDIERTGKMKMEVARRFFHPGEVEVLEALPDEKRNDMFFRYWSVKESFLKYTGSGLSFPLCSFEVCFKNNGIRIEKQHSRISVCIRECLIDKDYKCFVCSEDPETPDIRPFPVL